MMTHRTKHNIWKKTIAMGVLCLFLVNQLAWAYPSDALAPPTEIANEENRAGLRARMERIKHTVDEILSRNRDLQELMKDDEETGTEVRRILTRVIQDIDREHDIEEAHALSRCLKTPDIAIAQAIIVGIDRMKLMAETPASPEGPDEEVLLKVAEANYASRIKVGAVIEVPDLVKTATGSTNVDVQEFKRELRRLPNIENVYLVPDEDIGRRRFLHGPRTHAIFFGQKAFADAGLGKVIALLRNVNDALGQGYYRAVKKLEFAPQTLAKATKDETPSDDDRAAKDEPAATTLVKAQPLPSRDAVPTKAPSATKQETTETAHASETVAELVAGEMAISPVLLGLITPLLDPDTEPKGTGRRSMYGWARAIRELRDYFEKSSQGNYPPATDLEIRAYRQTTRLMTEEWARINKTLIMLEEGLPKMRDKKLAEYTFQLMCFAFVSTLWRAIEALGNDEGQPEEERWGFIEDDQSIERFLEFLRHSYIITGRNFEYRHVPDHPIIGFRTEAEYDRKDPRAPICLKAFLAARCEGAEPMLRCFPELATHLASGNLVKTEYIPPTLGNPPGLLLHFSGPVESMRGENFGRAITVFALMEYWGDVPDEGARDDAERVERDRACVEFDESEIQKLVFDESTPAPQRAAALRDVFNLALDNKLVARASYTVRSFEGARRLADFYARTPGEKEAIYYQGRASVNKGYYDIEMMPVSQKPIVANGDTRKSLARRFEQNVGREIAAARVIEVKIDDPVVWERMNELLAMVATSQGYDIALLVQSAREWLQENPEIAARVMGHGPRLKKSDVIKRFKSRQAGQRKREQETKQAVTAQIEALKKVDMSDAAAVHATFARAADLQEGLPEQAAARLEAARAELARRHEEYLVEQAKAAQDEARRKEQEKAAQAVEAQLAVFNEVDLSNAAAVRKTLDGTAKSPDSLTPEARVRFQGARRSMAERFIERSLQDAGTTYDAFSKEASQARPDDFLGRLTTASLLANEYDELRVMTPRIEAARARVNLMNACQRLTGPLEFHAAADLDVVTDRIRQVETAISQVEEVGDLTDSDFRAVEHFDMARNSLKEKVLGQVRDRLRNAYKRVAAADADWMVLTDILPLYTRVIDVLDSLELFLPEEKILLLTDQFHLRRAIEEEARENSDIAPSDKNSKKIYLPRGHTARFRHRYSGRFIDVTYGGNVEESTEGVTVAVVNASCPGGYVPVIGRDLGVSERHKGGWRNDRYLLRRIKEHGKRIEEKGHIINPLHNKVHMRAVPGGKSGLDNILWFFGFNQACTLMADQDIGLKDFLTIISDLQITLLGIPHNASELHLQAHDYSGLFEEPEVFPTTASPKGTAVAIAKGKKPSAGHEVTVTGKALTSRQDEVLREAQRELFDEGRMQQYRVRRGSRMYSSLDPDGRLARLKKVRWALEGADIFVIPDDVLLFKLRKACKAKGVRTGEAKTIMDILVSHAGTYQGQAQNIFILQSRAGQLGTFTKKLRRQWVRHEIGHIGHIRASERTVQRAAPIGGLKYEFAKRNIVLGEILALETLAERLVYLRNFRGWDVERLAEETKVDCEHMKKVEKGMYTKLRRATAIKLAQALNLEELGIDESVFYPSETQEIPEAFLKEVMALETTGERLKKLWEFRDWSLAYFAEKSGVSDTQIRKIAEDDVEWRIFNETTEKLAIALGVDEDILRPQDMEEIPQRILNEAIAMKAIGPRVKKLRKHRKWSIEYLADRSGMSISAIRRLENGETEQSTDETLGKLAVALGVDEGIFIIAKPAKPKRVPADVLREIRKLKTRGQRVVALRKYREWTQKRLFEESGVTISTVRIIENDKPVPHQAETIEELARALGVDESVLRPKDTEEIPESFLAEVRAMATPAQKLMALRDYREWTQRGLAKKARIGLEVVGRIESGFTKHPREATFRKLATALRVERAIFGMVATKPKRIPAEVAKNAQKLDTIGERLDELMNYGGWNATQLEAKSGVSRSVISNILNGKTKKPKDETLKKLAKALGVSKKTLVITQPKRIPQEILDRIKQLATREERLKAAREYRGLSQRELAEKAKIEPSQVNTLEIPGRVKNANVEHLKKLAAALGAEVDIFFIEDTASFLRSKAHLERGARRFKEKRYRLARGEYGIAAYFAEQQEKQYDGAARAVVEEAQSGIERCNEAIIDEIPALPLEDKATGARALALLKREIARTSQECSILYQDGDSMARANGRMQRALEVYYETILARMAEGRMDIELKGYQGKIDRMREQMAHQVDIYVRDFQEENGSTAQPAGETSRQKSLAAKKETPGRRKERRGGAIMKGDESFERFKHMLAEQAGEEVVHFEDLSDEEQARLKSDLDEILDKTGKASSPLSDVINRKKEEGYRVVKMPFLFAEGKPNDYMVDIDSAHERVTPDMLAHIQTTFGTDKVLFVSDVILGIEDDSMRQEAVAHAFACVGAGHQEAIDGQQKVWTDNRTGPDDRKGNLGRYLRTKILIAETCQRLLANMGRIRALDHFSEAEIEELAIIFRTMPNMPLELISAGAALSTKPLRETDSITLDNSMLCAKPETASIDIDVVFESKLLHEATHLLRRQMRWRNEAERLSGGSLIDDFAVGTPEALREQLLRYTSLRAECQYEAYFVEVKYLKISVSDDSLEAYFEKLKKEAKNDRAERVAAGSATVAAAFESGDQGIFIRSLMDTVVMLQEFSYLGQLFAFWYGGEKSFPVLHVEPKAAFENWAVSVIQRHHWTMECADAIRGEVAALEKGKKLAIVVDTSIGSMEVYGKRLAGTIERMAEEMGLPPDRFEIIVGEGSILAGRVNAFLRENENGIVRGVVSARNQRHYTTRFDDDEEIKQRMRLVAVNDEEVANTDKNNLHYNPIMQAIRYSLTGELEPSPYTDEPKTVENSVIGAILKFRPAEQVNEDDLIQRLREDALFLENA